MITAKPDWSSIYQIKNDDHMNNEGIKSLNMLVGLEWKDFDQEAIAKINYDRMQKMNLGGTS